MTGFQSVSFKKSFDKFRGSNRRGKPRIQRIARIRIGANFFSESEKSAKSAARPTESFGRAFLSPLMFRDLNDYKSTRAGGRKMACHERARSLAKCESNGPATRSSFAVVLLRTKNVVLRRTSSGITIDAVRSGGWCRRRDLNPRPRAYESLALPLSYAGP